MVLTIGDSLAPYERRIIELLRNSKDKRARKLAKKKVRAPDGLFRLQVYLTVCSSALSAAPRRRLRT